MKLSTEINSISRIVGEEKAIEYLAKAGFNAWDFSMFSMGKMQDGELVQHPLNTSSYSYFAKKLRMISDDNGVKCNQSHAPFPVVSPTVKSFLKRAIECTAIAGGEICVIHPANDWGVTQNRDFYLELLPFAKEHGVKIATENMWNYNTSDWTIIDAACSNEKSFVEHLQAVNDDYFVACLDIGHAEILSLNTSAVKMIKAIGQKLQALHIHDIDLVHDNHQIPFSLKIDFIPIIKALKEINYFGYFTLEADNYLRAFNEENAYQGVKDLYYSVKKIEDLFNKEQL
ncbi:MAG: sugar phosphate isomerase/epimerase [Clostridia bacterium]|nr:sugar phosphate isomerase/epimerase [Clostridia bacterium]